jgi:ACS family hexuronate transporter-like MFS transporter
MLFTASVISYFDRQTLSFVEPMVSKELDLNANQLGQIFSAFLLAYTFGQLVAGRLFDVIGSRVGFALSIGVWSLANTLTALVGGFRGLATCRFVLGLGESGNYPGGARVITEWFPPEERAFATGLFASGASVGAIVAGPLVAEIADSWGWRTAFAVPGSLGFLWLAGWWFLYRSPEPVHPSDADAPESPPRWLGLLRLRQVWALAIARFLEESAFWVWLFWTPKYLNAMHGLSVLKTGWMLTVPYVALDLGYLAGGWVSSRLVRNGWSPQGSKRIVMIAGALLMLSSIPAALSPRLASVLLFISLCYLGHGAWYTNAFAAHADVVPKGEVASFYGISALGGGLGGIAGNLLTGSVVDRFHSYTLSFVAAGIAPVLATVVWVLLGHVPSRSEGRRFPSASQS